MYYGCTLWVLSEGGVPRILSKQGVLGVSFETKLVIFATFENPQIRFVKPALAVRIEFYENIETNVGKPHWSGAVIALFTKKLWECELLGKLEFLSIKRTQFFKLFTGNLAENRNRENLSFG